MTPVLDQNFLDYGPPCAAEEGPCATNWLQIRYRYASLCASILQIRYSQNAPNTSTEQLKTQLRGWLRSLPPHLQSLLNEEQHAIELSDSSTLIGQQENRREILQAYFQYYGTLLVIYTRGSGQTRASIARKMLAASSQLTTSDVYSSL